MEYEFFYSVTFFLFFCMSIKKCLYMSASGDSCKWSLTFLKGCTCHEKTKNATLDYFHVTAIWLDCERVMAFFIYISLEFVDATPSTL